MREIKYRAWHKKEKRMFEFWQLDSVIKLIDEDWSIYELLSQNTILKDKFELMQFTGLKDKNGKEIYEGDVVKCFEFYEGDFFIETQDLQVCFLEGEWCLWQMKGNVKEYVVDLFSRYLNEGLEVIGNIYENPELIKEKKE